MPRQFCSSVVAILACFLPSVLTWLDPQPPMKPTLNTIKIGDLVLLPGDDRPWRVLDLYQGKAQIEFVGEAWIRIKTVPAGDLRIDPCERSTTTNA